MLSNKRCLKTFLISLVIPLTLQAQQQFELSVGISTPGTAVVATDMSTNSILVNQDQERSLSNLENNKYSSFIYPSISVQLAYKPNDTGFFDRFNILGYLSFHTVQFENVIIAYENGTRQTALKADLLAGLRYDILKYNGFTMYSQFLAGFDIWDNSGYWNNIYDHFSDGQRVTMQFTFIGLNFTLGNDESRLGALIEFGYGSEYAVNALPLLPGIRAGLSYRF